MTSASVPSAPATARVPLSILDLVSLSEGMSVRDAIDASMRTAQAADRLGYNRYWFAEHHNTHNLASNAPPLLIDRAASLTERIRVGSGGIMLPNHSPLTVAETFGTLVQFHGERIDLGLGRAPGTDPITAQFLARTSAEPAAFMEAVAQMRLWTSDAPPQGLRVTADVAEGTNVPMWVLASSPNGADLAARLGLPLAVASHFAPAQHLQVLDHYRRTFDAGAETAQITAPHTMVGVNVVVAETDEEAQRQFSTLQQMFLSIMTGQRRALQPPLSRDELAAHEAVGLLDRVEETLAIRAVGSPQTVVRELERIVRSTQADEVITTAYIFDPADRIRSLELLAEAWGLTAA